MLFNFDFSRGLKGVALGATIVVIIGLLDDAFDLPAVVKLAGQVAGGRHGIVYGVVLNVVPFWIPGGAWLNVLLTLLWFLTVTNALQFLDGMDGLAAGLGVIPDCSSASRRCRCTSPTSSSWPPRWWVPVSVFFLTICVPAAR